MRSQEDDTGMQLAIYSDIKIHNSESRGQEVAIIHETKIMRPLSELLYSPQRGRVYRNLYFGSALAMRRRGTQR